MSKGKLAKFAEVEELPNVIQPPFNEVFRNSYKLKGKWKSSWFKNNNPITLELGCGKGEYTVGQARLFPNRNFIGIDIKGSRIWKGAKEAHQEGLQNVLFIRTRIDFIESFFDTDEVEEIWFTFPDPQLKKPAKRLTSSRFLNRYKSLIVNNGTINLKTDNRVLYEYTEAIANQNNLDILRSTRNVYESDFLDEVLSIRTFYEKGWLKDGLTSHYIQIRLKKNNDYEEPPETE